MVVSHLSSFSYIDVDEAIGTRYQALCVDNNEVKKQGASISSLEDVRQVVESGLVEGWGQVLNLPKNKFGEGLGFHPVSARVKRDVVTLPIQEVFRSAGFIHPTLPEVDAIIGDDSEEDLPNFVTHGLVFQNWIAVDVPVVMHLSE